jgi:hypothetical protein
MVRGVGIRAMNCLRSLLQRRPHNVWGLYSDLGRFECMHSTNTGPTMESVEPEVW